MQADPDEQTWLLVSVSTGKIASLRVHVWRNLRKLGAVYLQQSVCLLPDLPHVANAVARLDARVRAQGGHSRVLRLQLTDPTEHAALVEEQRAGRDEEYAEVLQRVPQFLTEIETETARGKATYTEVEESEADLERFERWLAAIQARDYFDAPAGAKARAAVEQCRQALADFETAALHADTEDTDDTAPTARRDRAEASHQQPTAATHD
ncbi:Chromate resistance protein ChrB [Actinopolymorpha singaporensis]|nr:Chromate resistance protein ChrB [Actinopolymorpha singaporensis]